jgi:hypothetical protein
LAVAVVIYQRSALKKIMKNTHWFVGSLLLLALTARADTYLASPTSDFLILSNISGTVRVLDARGLVLEKNHSYMPRIALDDLSPAELQSLLETKTAYAGLTTFVSVRGTNGPGAAIENQLQQTWRQGKSLAGKIQTRLEILQDLRDYNTESALLPGSLAVAGQYAANDIAINNRLTNRAATTVAAAAQVEATAVNRAGSPLAQEAAQQAQENYRQMAVRVKKASDLDVISNGQITEANQQVAEHLAKCAALATRLASHGIMVSGVPPFDSIPPLMLEVEVNADRKAKL